MDMSDKPKSRYVVDLGKRVFSSAPPIITRPKIPDDISGFSTLDELIDKLDEKSAELFPFQRELAVYLLLIASLWPDDKQRLLTAARLFAGALNFHCPNISVEVSGGVQGKFRRQFQTADVQLFDERFIAKLGGLQSLLFCASIENFHSDIWKRVADLTVIHDVIEYLVKVSLLRRKLSSLTFAYNAIANNIFNREGGYGIHTGAKRRAGRVGWVTTAESVRAKCKRGPNNPILSFIMTRWYGAHLIDPANPKFFISLANQELSAAGIKLSLGSLRERLLRAKAAQNETIAKWAQVDAAPPRNSVLYTLKPDELERAFDISKEVLKIKLTEQECEAARHKLQIWWQQIPGR
jgi:hypothetical protein